MPGAAVIVSTELIIGLGANRSDYHAEFGYQRVVLGCKTGEGYELCEGCHPKNHSEPRAIENALARGYETKNADLYLWGHWWCCKWCWDSIIKAGIKNVYLLENSEVLFNKTHPENIVGRQLELPMTQQDQQFQLSVKNFINEPLAHRQWLSRWLAEKIPEIPADIDPWTEGKNLPPIHIRMQIINSFINHGCDCNCK